MDLKQQVVFAVMFVDGLIVRSFASEPDAGAMLRAAVRAAKLRAIAGLGASPIQAATWYPLSERAGVPHA